MTDETIHARLRQDSLPLGRTRFSVVRLFNDSRWPWLMLMPLLADGEAPVGELHQLPPPRRIGFLEDVSSASAILQDVTRCDSVNIGMLGNVVADLHCHVLARFHDDPAWPSPVWGFGTAIPYTADNRPLTLIDAVCDGLTMQSRA